MNKKLQKILLNKLPIIAFVILSIMYIYVSIPDNYIIQVGGASANAVPMPKNVPFKYKYRWLFVVIPILITIHLIYSIYYFYTIKSLTTWDLARDFFQNFFKQTKIAKDQKMPINYEDIDPSMINKSSEPDLYKFANFVQLASNPRSGLYNFSQYFCNSFRPCSCCHEDAFLSYFSNGKNGQIGTANTEFINKCKQVKDGKYKAPSTTPSKAPS